MADTSTHLCKKILCPMRTTKGTFEVRVVKPDTDPEVMISLTSMPRPFKKVTRLMRGLMNFIVWARTRWRNFPLKLGRCDGGAR